MSSEDGKRLSENGFKYYVVSKEGAFMRLSSGQRLYFRGKLRFKAVKGKWSIMGALLGPESSSVNVYCPTGYSYLCLESTLESSRSSKEEKRILRSLDLERNSDIGAFLKESTHVALLECLPDAPWNLFLSSHIANVKPKLPLFEKNKRSDSQNPFEAVLDIRILNPNSPRLFESIPEWDIAIRSVDLARESGLEVPKIIIAGGKGVGKSSFSKYLLNRLLNKSPVYFVDLDPGQGEFDPPGFISVHLITDPVLGPNFTHMNIQPRISFYVGDVNMMNCSERFLHCMQSLIQKLEEVSHLQPYPWIVNTMGFSKGLGIVFMVDTIRLIQPSTLVNIQSRFPKKNFDLDFSPFSISTLQTKSWFTKPGVHLEYNVLQFSAVPESGNVRDMRATDNWGIPEPKKLRDIVLLSHLGGSLFSQKDFFSRKVHSLQGLTPIEVPWSEVSIQLLHVPASESKHALDIINASLVSLGVIHNWDDDSSIPAHSGSFKIIPKTVIARSLGLGFIRSVDRAKKVFYLLTALSGPILKSVNVLSCGAVFLPEGCFNPKDNSSQEIAPYVQKSSEREKQNGGNPLDRPWRRSYRPMN